MSPLHAFPDDHLTEIIDRRSADPLRASAAPGEGLMLDLVFLALGLAAFALFGGYAALLRRL